MACKVLSLSCWRDGVMFMCAQCVWCGSLR